ncbi:acyl-CoA-binding protein homolog [Adelges cooleyi]|uniref:acyl-CoA-binding protein homolog n=1 Tax=Adelges cooleyi TaxID=133065 RepID=UPI00217F8993|nr:acyl-CoA-binding protein homolog [Adelges cooleyi]
MASLQERFEAAALEVRSLTKRPTNEELLELYALYKQGTKGDNTTSKPGLFDLKAKKKWEYWNDVKGTSTEDAQEKYVAKVNEYISKYKD